LTTAAGFGNTELKYASQNRSEKFNGQNVTPFAGIDEMKSGNV